MRTSVGERPGEATITPGDEARRGTADRPSDMPEAPATNARPGDDGVLKPCDEARSCPVDALFDGASTLPGIEDRTKPAEGSLPAVLAPKASAIEKTGARDEKVTSE